MNFEEILNNSKASIEKEDLKILLPIIAEIKPRRILEIGGWKGYSADVWIKAFNPDNFVSMEKDPKFPDGIERIDERYTYFYNTNSHDQYTLIKTKATFDPWKLGNQVDFLFIDGDHSLEGVKKDFEMYSPLVRRGGIIVFHDAIYHADKTEEVDIFWNAIKKQYPFVEIKVGKNSTGIGVIFA
jgi:predicted O-methyltransferase YrrM